MSTKKAKPLRESKALVYGVGINDSEYQVNIFVNGKYVLCPFYSAWSNMLYRCYSGKYKSYSDCTVCGEWALFSSFKRWMKAQDWKGKQLDKDILKQGNKIYCSDYCFFVDGHINKLLIGGNASKSGGLKGASLIRASGRYRARGSDSKGNMNVSLGCFSTEIEAHNAYKEFRYKVIREFAETQEEPIYSALLSYVII